jgi:hypothetical protein
MDTLLLPVNRFFFNQIKAQQLVEDFRAIKPYWIKLLIKKEYLPLEPLEVVELYITKGNAIFNNFNKIIFTNGYSEDSPKISVNFGGMRLTHPFEMTCMGQGIAFAIEVKY